MSIRVVHLTRSFNDLLAASPNPMCTIVPHFFSYVDFCMTIYFYFENIHLCFCLVLNVRNTFVNKYASTSMYDFLPIHISSKTLLLIVSAKSFNYFISACSLQTKRWYQYLNPSGHELYCGNRSPYLMVGSLFFLLNPAAWQKSTISQNFTKSVDYLLQQNQ